MKRKIIKKLVGTLIIAAFLLTNINLVKADGMIIPEPFRRVYETDQKAVILYEDGMERLVISIGFEGDAGNFAWIVPTPTQPEVGKSVDSLFTKLDEITRLEYPMPEPAYMERDMLGVANESKGVTVLETKKIDYYDIAVLEASDESALYNWLNDNGYPFPQAGKAIVDEYIKKGWYFTAVKIDQNQNQVAQQQLSRGHATPLMLSFETDKIVYPMKISSINGLEDNSPQGEVTYIDGVVGGQAVQIDNNKYISTDNVIDGIDVNDMSVGFYVKKRQSKPLGTVIQATDSDTVNGAEKYSFRISNTIGNGYNVLIRSGKGHLYTGRIDLGSDYKENEWQRLDFSWKIDPNDQKKIEGTLIIDDISRPLVLRHSGSSSSSGISSGINMDDLRIILGLNNAQSGDLLIDELQINSAHEIVVVAEFEGHLKVNQANNEETAFRVYENNKGPAFYNQNDSSDYPGITQEENRIVMREMHPYSPIDSMGVLLYIFSDKRQELTGFQEQFAGPMSKDEIEKIALIDGEKPWIEPKNEKYILTRLYRHMNMAEMTEDLYPRESEDQSVLNFPGNEKENLVWIWVLIGISILSVAGMIYYVMRQAKKDKKPNGNKKQSEEKIDNNPNH